MLHLLIAGAALSQISKSDDVASININISDVKAYPNDGGDIMAASGKTDETEVQPKSGSGVVPAGSATNGAVAPTNSKQFEMTVGTINHVYFERIGYGKQGYCDFESFNDPAETDKTLPYGANRRKEAVDNMFGLCKLSWTIYPTQYEDIRNMFNDDKLCQNAPAINQKQELTQKEAADLCSYHPACWGFTWGWKDATEAKTKAQLDNAKGTVEFWRIAPPGVDNSYSAFTDETTAKDYAGACYRKMYSANQLPAKMHSIDHAVFSGKTIYADPDDKRDVNAGHGIVCFLAAVSAAYILLYMIVYGVSKVFDQKFPLIAKIYPSGPRSMIEGHMGGEPTYSLFS